MSTINTQEENKARKVAFRDIFNEAREKHVVPVNYVKYEEDILSYSRFRLMVELKTFNLIDTSL